MLNIFLNFIFQKFKKGVRYAVRLAFVNEIKS